MGKFAALFGGNWDNGANCGSRASIWNNSPANSNVNIGLRGVCEDAHCLRMADRPGLARFIAAWRGHARHADTCNLFNHLERRHGVRLHQQPR